MLVVKFKNGYESSSKVNFDQSQKFNVTKRTFLVPNDYRDHIEGLNKFSVVEETDKTEIGKYLNSKQEEWVENNLLEPKKNEEGEQLNEKLVNIDKQDLQEFLEENGLENFEDKGKKDLWQLMDEFDFGWNYRATGDEEKTDVEEMRENIREVLNK